MNKNDLTGSVGTGKHKQYYMDQPRIAGDYGRH